MNMKQRYESRKMIPNKSEFQDQEPYQKTNKEDQNSAANRLAGHWIAIVMRLIWKFSYKDKYGYDEKFHSNYQRRGLWNMTNNFLL